VVPFPILEIAWKEAKKLFEREHTTPFIWERPDRFRIGNVLWKPGIDHSMSHRFTIDFPEDYLFVKGVYEHLWNPNGPPFSVDEILYLLEREPPLREVNKKYVGVNWYSKHLDELRTVTADQTRMAS
jgi:spore coat polysaccharide biosynthesis protein SpsF